ncbi:MAG: hypothetical protein IT275_01045 [Chitinophagales bacterium]|nr:hypothetical protein [Chitinophagales bacterium]HNB49278.1 hypothetical protein [Chitinophagales bacterium]
MKQNLITLTLFLLVHLSFADVPIDDNEGTLSMYSNANFLPLILGVATAIAIFVFMYVYKNKINEKK